MQQATQSTKIGPRQDWFGSPKADAQYLQLWRDARVTYERGRAFDASWHHDLHQMEIGTDPDGSVFARASDLLLRYEFYPHHILIHTSDFTLENRLMKTGDNVVQRIRPLRINGLHVADILTMTRISEVTCTPDCVGFAYVTTEAHMELGEWSVRVERREGDSLWVVIDSVSKPGQRLPELSRTLARNFQLEAHHKGLENFKALCLKQV